MGLPFLLISILIISFTDLSTSTHSKNEVVEEDEYLRLKLVHRNDPYRTPQKTLVSDSHRLSVLLSTLPNRKALKNPVVSGASSGSGQYFVSFRVGTPPQKILLVADTGSDLVWVKCSACRDCSRHEKGTSFFARHSSTFAPFHCYDKACQLVPQPPRTHCNKTRMHSTCRYQYSYADGSRSSGFFAKETTTLQTSSGKNTKLKNLAFGCGFNISGNSVSGASFNGAHGVMGLGQGPISFSTQVGKKFGNKFSYCLMDYTISPPPTSYLILGKANTIKKMNFTPLLANPLSPTFYYIGIQSVEVNGKKLDIDSSIWEFDDEGNGGTIMDSGTTLTFLAEPAYIEILNAFDDEIKYPKIFDPALGFDLCINVTGVEKVSLPLLSFRFVGNSVFSPPVTNYFIDAADDIMCLALQSVTSPLGFSVFGNLMQQGYLFEFDREDSKLGFSRHGCAHP